MPSAGRPHMPGYDLPAADSGRGVMPWSWAAERLVGAHNYWLATSWPDGRPHVMPVWGVWLDTAFWFSCAGTARKARNLAADPGKAGDLILAMNEKLNALIDGEVGEDVGQMLPKAPGVTWAITKFDP